MAVRSLRTRSYVSTVLVNLEKKHHWRDCGFGYTDKPFYESLQPSSPLASHSTFLPSPNSSILLLLEPLHGLNPNPRYPVLCPWLLASRCLSHISQSHILIVTHILQK